MPDRDHCATKPQLDFYVRTRLNVLPVERHLENLRVAEALVIAIDRIAEVEGGSGPTIKAIAKALMMNDGSDLMRRLMEDEPAKEST